VASVGRVAILLEDEVRVERKLENPPLPSFRHELADPDLLPR
jgi:hypothetical protein